MKPSTRACSLLVCALLAGCGGVAPPLHCADGGLPCPDQIASFQCDHVTPGTFPPDAAELRFLISGAKIPQNQEPPVNLTDWCSGHLVAAGIPMQVELFQGIDGGFISVPGRDKAWFMSPPEVPEEQERRMCAGYQLPDPKTYGPASCTSLDGGPPLGRDAFLKLMGSAHSVTKPDFGDPKTPWMACNADVGGATYRLDVFSEHRGLLRLPGEAKICFVY